MEKDKFPGGTNIVSRSAVQYEHFTVQYSPSPNLSNPVNFSKFLHWLKPFGHFQRNFDASKDLTNVIYPLIVCDLWSYWLPLANLYSKSLQEYIRIASLSIQCYILIRW